MNALHALELADLDQVISDYRLAESETEQQELKERFRVNNLSSANWCLRKLRSIQVKVNEINELADAEVERINAWRDKETSGLKHEIAFFEMLLAEYHAEQLQLDPKAKTITTPYGKLKSTTRKPAPTKVDDELLLIHLQRNKETDFIVVKESAAWGEYKKTLQIVDVDGEYKVVDQNGEVVPGVSVDLGGTSYKVEISE